MNDNIIDGSLQQIDINNRFNHLNIPNYPNCRNIVHNYEYFKFGTDEYNTFPYLNLPRTIDKCCPEYLVCQLFENATIDFRTIYELLDTMMISLYVGTQHIIDFPLTLLWLLNEPQLVDNKIYIKIPFENFFGDINLITLNYSYDIQLRINNNTLMNYVSQFDIMCKITIYSPHIRNQFIDMSNNIIQHISSLSINTDITNDSLEYRIRTNNFSGLTKGFFIEADDIDEDLIEIKYYLDSFLIRNYDNFLIKNKTMKISNNLIYFAFNPNDSFVNNGRRDYNAIDGCINLSLVFNQVLNLKFKSPKKKVKIYGLNINNYNQHYGTVQFLLNNNIFHTKQHFHQHPLIPLEDIFNNMNNFVNQTILNPPILNQPTNYGNTGPLTTHPITYIEPLPTSITVSQLINPSRNICSITHDEILLDQRYMSCASCHCNFHETPLKQWFLSRIVTQRTCPICRTIWIDYKIYINRNFYTLEQ